MKKMEMLNFYVDADLQARLDRLTQSEFAPTRSQLVRYCLQKGLPQLEQKFLGDSHD